MTTMTTQAIQKAEPKSMEFVPYGASDKIRLTVDIVKNLVAVPTRSGKTCSDRDALNFMMLCQAKRLNPFEGDAFLIGFDTKNGPKFNLVTAHQAYLKRAELHPEFDGFRSGIILNTDGAMHDVEGEILPDGSELIGAWCSVHFKNRKLPITKRIPLTRFSRQVAQQGEWGGPWKDDPCGMVTKCAEADALRSAFPTMLGGLYLRDEVELSVQTNHCAADIPAERLISVVQSPVATNEADDAAEAEAGLAPTKPAPTKSETQTPQQELADFVTGAGFDFTIFARWAAESGNIPNVESLTCFDDIPTKDAVRFLRAKTGLLQGLKVAKEGK